MTKVKRNFKDSLFRLVFHGKEELLSLYNAVNGSSYTNADDLEINTLEDVVYMGMKNDVSFLFAHYLNLYEAQSTSNPNMPLRGTIYFGDLIKGWVESNHLDMYVRRHIVGGENRTLISVKTPLRLCRTGTCRKLSAERPQIVVALFERQLVLLLK